MGPNARITSCNRGGTNHVDAKFAIKIGRVKSIRSWSAVSFQAYQQDVKSLLRFLPLCRLWTGSGKRKSPQSTLL